MLIVADSSTLVALAICKCIDVLDNIKTASAKTPETIDQVQDNLAAIKKA